MADPVIVDRVTKRFAGHTAVDALSLSVPSGIIYGLLGPNGAGKTTTLRMIMDIYEPDSGVIRLFDQVGGGRTNSARIGYLPEERGLYPKMRVLDVLVFLAEAKAYRVVPRGPKHSNGWTGSDSPIGKCGKSPICRKVCSRRCSSSPPCSTTPSS